MDTDPEFMQHALNYFTPKRKSLNSGRFCEYIRRQPHSVKLSTEAIQNIFYECIRCIRRQPDHALAGWASHQIIPPRIPTLPPYESQNSTKLRKQQLKYGKLKQQTLGTEVSLHDESDVSIFDSAIPDEAVYAGVGPVQELDIGDGDNGKDHDDGVDVDNNANSDYSMGYGSSPFTSIATADSKSGSPQVHNDMEGLHKISMSPGNQNNSPPPHPAQLSPPPHPAQLSPPPHPAQLSPPQSQHNTLEQRLTRVESSLTQFLNTFSQSSPNSESTRNLLLNSLTTENPLPFHGDAKADAKLYLTGKRTDFLLYLHLYGLDPAHVMQIINPLAIHVINVYATEYLFHQRLQVAFEGFLMKLERGITTDIDSGIGGLGVSYLSVETAHSARVFLDEVHALQKESLNSN